MLVVQQGPAVLAVNRIAIVADQATTAAFEIDAGRPQHRPHQIEEQADPDDHHEDRQEAAPLPGQGDIAEAGRRQGGDGEIDRVGVSAHLRIHPVLQGEDHPRHHEDENEEIEPGTHRHLLLLEPGREMLQLAQHLIGNGDAPRPQDAEEGEAFQPRKQQRGDDDEIEDRRQP